MNSANSLPSHRGKPNILLLLAGLFFLIGIILLSSFGPIKLSCSRINGSQVDCLLTRSVAFGFIKEREISISSLKEARVDEQVKRTLEGKSFRYVRKTPVYGVLLVSSESAVLDGYSYNREQQQKIVNQINSFLSNPNAPSLFFQARNHWLDIVTLSSLGLPISLLLRMLLKQWANKSLSRNGA